LILTGQRRGEVAGMARDEISPDLMTWTLPGERTKNGIAHTVPLSAPARDILKTMPESEIDDQRERHGLVLPGAIGTPFAGWSKAKKALDNAITKARASSRGEDRHKAALLIPWNVHDLRRTVATGLQRLGVRLEVTEAVLNHISGSRGGIAGVYQRHDWGAEKRAALDAWAAHGISLVNSQTGGDNVVQLARAR
jgi:integrase